MLLKRASLSVVLASAIAACAIEASSTAPKGDGADAAPEAATSDDAAVAIVDAAPESDAPPTCALAASYGSKACNACVAEQCCAEIAACEAEATCKALSDCFHGCMDEPDGPGCVKDCRMKHPDDAGAWAKVEGCWYGPKKCLPVCA